MSKRDFEALLNRHEEAEHEVDWAGQKEQWLHFVEAFYKTIESWLAPYVAEKKLSYAYTEKEIQEEHIGYYQVRVMHIRFAGQEVRLDPIGTVLIGSIGRIDMEGIRGRVQFVLADKHSTGKYLRIAYRGEDQSGSRMEHANAQVGWTWKILSRDARGVSFDEFNEENFFETLMEVSSE